MLQITDGVADAAAAGTHDDCVVINSSDEEDGPASTSNQTTSNQSPVNAGISCHHRWTFVICFAL